MPAISSNASALKVLVSGANGYIAMWVVDTLLKRGFSVRGTVRSAEKGKHLKETFKSYGDKLELCIVEDITKEGAFDEAVKGVHAIEHTASPFHYAAKDPQELIGPAVKGTVGMLASALKYGSSVQRVVVTSSCASVLFVDTKPHVFSEADWNVQSPKEVEDLGEKTPPSSMYRASKVMAERAAWAFWNKHKSEVKWDLVCLNPPLVFGPGIHDVSGPDSLNTSALLWYKRVAQAESDPEALLQSSCWIDVRDLAEAHVRSLEKEAAGGERIIIAAGHFVWQDWIDAANSLSPSPRSKPIPKGVPGCNTDATYLIKYDTTKEARILGIKKSTMQDLARDTLADFEARGW